MKFSEYFYETNKKCIYSPTGFCKYVGNISICIKIKDCILNKKDKDGKEM